MHHTELAVYIFIPAIELDLLLKDYCDIVSSQGVFRNYFLEAYYEKKKK